MSHLNIAFDRYAFIGTVMHYILVISRQYNFDTTFVKRQLFKLMMILEISYKGLKVVLLDGILLI